MTSTAAAADSTCAARGAPPRPPALMHTASPTPQLELQRPLLTTCLARCAADRVYFLTINTHFLFLQIDDVGSAAGEAMVLDFYEGL